MGELACADAPARLARRKLVKVRRNVDEAAGDEARLLRNIETSQEELERRRSDARFLGRL